MICYDTSNKKVKQFILQNLSKKPSVIIFMTTRYKPQCSPFKNNGLPAVMLGLWSVVQQDRTSPPPKQRIKDALLSKTHVTRYWSHFDRGKRQRAVWHGNQKPFNHPDFDNCDSVGIRKDSLRGVLLPPYTGPSKVVNGDKVVFCSNISYPIDSFMRQSELIYG